MSATRRAAWALAALIAASPVQAQGRWQAFIKPTGYAAIEADTASIWLASLQSGLLRFDRRAGSFETFNRVPNQLASNELTALAFDRGGRLWVGTQASGVSVRSADGALWRLVSRLDQLPSDSVTALAADRDNLWIGTRAGLAFWNGSGEGSIDAYWPNEDEQPFTSNVVRDIVVVDTTVWVATAQGVYRNSTVSAGAWTAEGAGLPGGDIPAVATDSASAFALSGGAVYRFVAGSWVIQPLPVGVTASTLSGRLGWVLAGTSGGIYRWTGAGPSPWVLMPHRRPPGVDPGPAVGLALATEDTTFWSVNAAGLWCNAAEPRYPAVQDSLYWRYYAPNAPAGNNLSAVLLDGARVYVSAVGNGVSRYDGATWTNWTTGCTSCSDGFLSPYFCYAGLVDLWGYKWMGCWDLALERFDDGGATPFFTHYWTDPDPDSQRHRKSWSFAVDSLHRIWIGNDTDALGTIEPIGLDSYDSLGIFLGNWQVATSGLRGNQIRALVADHNGLMWIGYAERGVDSFRPPPSIPGSVSPVPLFTNETQQYADVFGLAVSENDLWVLTARTLERWSATSKLRVFQILLPARPVQSLAVHPLDLDAGGDAWVGTEGGLIHVTRDGLHSTRYTKSNSPLVGDQVRTVRVDRARGVIWIGTTSGLNSFEPGYVPPPPPPVAALALRIYPNPARLTGLGVQLRIQGNAAQFGGTVYDIGGRRVRRFPASAGGVFWDGRDDDGELVPPGLYFVRVAAGGLEATARVVLVR